MFLKEVFQSLILFVTAPGMETDTPWARFGKLADGAPGRCTGLGYSV